LAAFLTLAAPFGTLSLPNSPARRFARGGRNLSDAEGRVAECHARAKIF
jgi:hypothetical protein